MVGGGGDGNVVIAFSRSSCDSAKSFCLSSRLSFDSLGTVREPPMDFSSHMIGTRVKDFAVDVSSALMDNPSPVRLTDIVYVTRPEELGWGRGRSYLSDVLLSTQNCNHTCKRRRVNVIGKIRTWTSIDFSLPKCTSKLPS